MQTDVLQKFLDQRLLDLGEDPKRFDDLEKAAEEVAKSLRANLHLLANGAALLLGNVDDDEPVLDLCREAITTNWPTYGSRFPSSPTQLFRAVLLEAIARVTKSSDPLFAAIVSYSTQGLASYVVSAREESIFRNFLSDLAQLVETEAARIWGLPRFTSSNFANDGDPEVPDIDLKALKQALKNAAGVSGATGANPQWPGSNSAEWLEHYAEGSAAAISKAVSEVLHDLVRELEDQTTKRIEAFKSVLDQGSSNNLRADVLYWKAALFSPSRRISYREMSEDGAVYWMAYDLHSRIPQFHPQSVEFFLREALRAAIGDRAAKKRLKLEQFGSAIRSEGAYMNLATPEDAVHRLTILEAVQRSASDQLDPHVASSNTGIPPETMISRDEIAVLLFRDFQVLRLIGVEEVGS